LGRIEGCPAENRHVPQKQVKQIETQIQFKIKNSAALNSKASRLQQIQGFGVITSASFLARLLPRIITR